MTGTAGPGINGMADVEETMSLLGGISCLQHKSSLLLCIHRGCILIGVRLSDGGLMYALEAGMGHAADSCYSQLICLNIEH